MKKTYLKTVFAVALAFGMTACSGEATDDNTETSDNTELNDEQEEPQEEIEEESALGNFEGLIGDWSVSAEIAGLQMDLTFGEDGSFHQKMGEIESEGTWEVVDEEHVRVSTPNTKGDGQTWLVSNLTESNVDICWNPDSPKPKTLPMSRVK